MISIGLFLLGWYQLFSVNLLRFCSNYLPASAKIIFSAYLTKLRHSRNFVCNYKHKNLLTIFWGGEILVIVEKR